VFRARNERSTLVLALDSDLFPGLSLSLGSGPDPIAPPLLGASERDETGQWGWSEGVDATTAAQRFATAAPDGVRLLQRGKIARQGFEPISGASKAFWEVAHGLVDAPAFRHWSLIGDLPAGTHQLVEDWAPYADIHLIIVQPSAQSARTAQRVASLARQHTPQAAVVFIANRVQREQDVRRVEELVGEPVFASLPDDEGVAAAERIGAGLSNLRQTADEPLEPGPRAPCGRASRANVQRSPGLHAGCLGAWALLAGVVACGDGVVVGGVGAQVGDRQRQALTDA
jgi:CO dehydrogenase nickel-insertion accessory protein CooC1